jgi:hypothetical protein
MWRPIRAMTGPTGRRLLTATFPILFWVWWLWVPPRPIVSRNFAGPAGADDPFMFTRDGRAIVHERRNIGGCVPGPWGPMRILDLTTGRERMPFGEDFFGRFVAGVAPDGLWLAIDEWGDPYSTVVVSTVDGRELARFNAGARTKYGGLWQSVVVPDGSGLALLHSATGEVRWWNALPGIVRPAIPPASTLVFSPDGSRVASVDRSAMERDYLPSESRMIRVWDLVTRREIARHHLPEWTRPVFSPDGRRLVWLPLSVGQDPWPSPARVQLWDFEAGTSPTTFRESSESPGIGGLEFSPDGRRLALHTAVGVQFWDMAESPPRFRSGLRYPARPTVGAMHSEQLPVFAPNGGPMVVPGGPHSVVLCDTTDVTRRAVCRFSQADRTPILKFAPDGATLAIMTGYDRPAYNPIEQLCSWYLGVPAMPSRAFTAQLFDTKTGAERTCWTLRGDDCRPIGFSPDGRILWTRTHHVGSVEIRGWDVAPATPPVWLLAVTPVGLGFVVADRLCGRRRRASAGATL